MVGRTNENISVNLSPHFVKIVVKANPTHLSPASELNERRNFYYSMGFSYLSFSYLIFFFFLSLFSLGYNKKKKKNISAALGRSHDFFFSEIFQDPLLCWKLGGKNMSHKRAKWIISSLLRNIFINKFIWNFV